MNKEEILKVIQDLSKSQGFYGRLLRDINEEPELLEHLAKQNFNEPLDLILYLEA